MDLPNLVFVWVVKVLLYGRFESSRCLRGFLPLDEALSHVEGMGTLRNSIAVLRSATPPDHSINCNMACSEGCAAMVTDQAVYPIETSTAM